MTATVNCCIVISFLAYLWIPEGLASFSIPNCNANGNFDIVEGQRQSITCTGLSGSYNIFWSITPPRKQEIIIGECRDCVPYCWACSKVLNDYAMRRTYTNTTLTFVNNLSRNNEALLRCSNFNRALQATCRLFVIQAYRLSSCQDNRLLVREDGTTSIRCEGLNRAQNMYWTIANSTSSKRIAECLACPNTGNCPSCRILNSDFTVIREATYSEVRILGNVGEKNGSKLSCVKWDLATYAQCQIHTIRKPDKLRLNDATCPAYITEGSHLRCACGHSPSGGGSPQAYVSWTYNTTSSVLDIPDVRRDRSGTVYTCRSVWGPNEDVFAVLNYKMRVAYGPSNLTLTRLADVGDDLDLVIFLCTSVDASPAVNFQWSIPCLTLNSSAWVSVCSVKKPTLSGKEEVVCSASNTENSELILTASFPLPQSTGADEADQGSGMSSAETGAVAAVVAVVFIAAVVVIIVVVIRRRRKSKDRPPHKDNLASQPADEFTEYINDCYESTDDVSGAVGNGINDAGYINQQQSAPHQSAQTSNSLQIDTATRASDNMENNLYSEVDVAVQDNSGRKADIQSDKSQGRGAEKAGRGPVTDIYAEVQKPKGGKRKADNVKKSEGSKDEQPVTGKPSTEYANFASEDKGDKLSDVYMNVAQTVSTPTSTEVTQTAENGDEYNSLQFVRPDPVEHNEQYSHLDYR